MAALQELWEVRWWLCPNESGWKADLPDFASLVPTKFSDGVPVLSRINQARELLRVAALQEPAEVVLWLDDDMDPSWEQMDSLARTAIRPDTKGILVSPLMRNRHTRDNYTCAWVYTFSKGVLQSSGEESVLPIPSVSFLPIEVDCADIHFAKAHGVGLGCTAHPWSFLKEFSFPAVPIADDEWLSSAFSRSGRTEIVVDYLVRVGHCEGETYV